jgi:hypothetical protein
MDCRIKSGNDDAKKRSRDALRFPGAAQHGAQRSDALLNRDRYKL